MFSGEVGSTYDFLCLARDTAGNFEPMDGNAETSTTVELPPPPSLQRGDCNGDGRPDISDAIFGLDHLFLGGESPECIEACEVNSDNQHDLSDPIYLLTFLFLGGSVPEAPFPNCGVDGDPENSLGCEATGCT